MYSSTFVSVKPISINTCFQGRRFRTVEFKKWQDLVIRSLPNKTEFENKSKEIKMRIRLYLKEPTRSDIDNYLKPLIDCCVKKGIIKDDRYIEYLEVIKKQNKEEGFEIEIL